MIETLSINNIRVFKDKLWELPCADLTIFAGTNSAGKSTALKIPFLLKQTQEIGVKSTWPAGKLLLSGEEIDFGDFDTLLSANSGNTQSFSIGITYTDTFSLENLKPAISEQNLSRFNSLGEELPLAVNWESTYTKDNVGGKDASLQTSVFSLSFSGDRIFEFQVFRQPQSKRPVYDLGISTQYLTNLKAINQLQMTHENGRSFCPVVMSGCLPTSYETVWLRHKLHGQWPLPPLAAAVVTSIKKMLDSLNYIGPFRAPASRYYITRGELSKLDSVGNFVPYVLKNNLNDSIIYPPPSSSLPLRSGTLEQSLQDWLHFFRTGEFSESTPQEFRFNTTNSTFGELKLRSPSGNSSHAIIDSGFGYSQILPIIVRALMCNPGDTLVIEQPELHLNPALQVRCAFFLNRMVSSGRRIVVETHSEHIINALRVHAVELGNSENVLINFFESSSLGLLHTKIAIDSMGNLDFWPKGFFGEALELSAKLLKAQSAKRSKIR